MCQLSILLSAVLLCIITLPPSEISKTPLWVNLTIWRGLAFSDKLANTWQLVNGLIIILITNPITSDQLFLQSQVETSLHPTLTCLYWDHCPWAPLLSFLMPLLILSRKTTEKTLKALDADPYFWELLSTVHFIHFSWQSSRSIMVITAFSSMAFIHGATNLTKLIIGSALLHAYGWLKLVGTQALKALAAASHAPMLDS